MRSTVTDGVPLRSLLAVLIGVWPCSLSGQEARAPITVAALSGVVLELDERSEEAPVRTLPNIAVSVIDSAGEVVTGVLTDSRGAFSLPDLAPGNYTLRVESIGYAPREIPVRVQPGTGSAPVEVHLTQEAIGLAAVVIRAEGETHRPATVLSGDELVQNLDESLASTVASEPGVNVVSMGPATEAPVIRGLTGDRILVLEDGVRVSDFAATGPDHGIAVDPVSAGRIEIVRGPSALLFGPNALGGVINVVSNSIPAAPVSGLIGSMTLRGRTVTGSRGAAGHVVFPMGGAALSLEGHGSTAGNLKTPLGEVGNSPTESYGFTAGGALFGDASSFGASHRHFRHSYGIPPDPVSGHVDGVDIEMRRDATRGRAIWNDRVGFRSIQLDLSYSWSRLKEFESPGIIGTFHESRVGGLDLLARHDRKGIFSSGALGFHLGLEDFGFAGTLRTPNTLRTTAAAFVYESVEMGPLELEASARVGLGRMRPATDDPDSPIGHVRTRSYGELSGSLGAAVDLTAGASMGVTAARVTRLPHAIELFAEGPHLAAYIFEVGNPDLEAEAGTGYDAYVGWENEWVHLDMVFFRTRFDSYIYSRDADRVSPVQLPVFQFVGEDVQLQGIEMSLEVHPVEWLEFGAVANQVLGTLTEDSEPLPLMPPTQLRTRLDLEAGAWFLGASAEFVAQQRNLGSFETPTDGYSLFDLEGGLRVSFGGRLHLVSLSLENVGDTEYRNHLSRIKHLFPGPGRNLRALYRLVF